MDKRRVVITGIGAVTPIGHGPRGLWDGVRLGHSSVRRISRFDSSRFRSQVAAEIGDFDAVDWMDSRQAKRLDRFAQFGVVAARQAIEDAGLNVAEAGSCNIGVSIGSALGGVAFGESQHSEFLRAGIRSVAPMLALAVYGGSGASNIAIDLDLRGPNLTNANSCASGAIAIGEAVRIIQRGEVEVMLAGGVEAPLAPLTFGAFSLIKAMSARNEDPAGACRPFDVDRDGFVMAEGAAILVLEERSVALRRGARIHAEIEGYAQTNDAYHMTAPRPDGSEAARAIGAALDDAGVSPTAVDYVNAHATGTPLGDSAEARAIALSLGDRAATVPVSGTKGLHGHALGASGAIEAALTALALECNFLPGTLNLRKTEPDCRLKVLSSVGLEFQAERAITTSFGFGGTNAALLLRRPDAEAGASFSA